MTPTEAKKVLLLRRGPADDADPQIAEALARAEGDPELGSWLRAHNQFQTALRTSFRQLPVPSDLARRIVAHAPAPRLTWWHRFPAWAAAAAIVVTFIVVVGQWRSAPADDDSFATFRSRMVRSVLRQYQMDIETNNMTAVRQYLDKNQAPADYVFTGPLNQLTLRGAGLQSWGDRKVSMVCFDSGGQGTAIVFVVESGAVKQPPSATPDFTQVSKLMTASWTSGNRAYLLMIDNSKVDRSRLQKFL